MENLNAEQIKKALECCSDAYDCFTCDIYKRKCIGGFRESMARKALALITSQEQRIAELTEEVAVKVVTLIELDKQINRLTEEKERLLTALANYDRLTDVRIAEEYYTAEAYEELREENERLVRANSAINNAVLAVDRMAKADTVRNMQQRITEHATNGYPRKVRLDVIDQIAKEMLEGEK